MAGAQQQLDEKGRVLDKVWRSLSSPGGSGQIAEIGLANTLKSFGLEEGRDFELQATTAGRGERDGACGPMRSCSCRATAPSSSTARRRNFCLEIAEAEGARDEEAAYANLARTMNGHLKALDDKDYRGAVHGRLARARAGGEMARILSIMYLPNEARAGKAVRAPIRASSRGRARPRSFPAGPAGLHCALVARRGRDRKQRQAENQQRIVEGAQDLLEALATALGLAAGVGKGIKAAAERFENLTAR